MSSVWPKSVGLKLNTFGLALASINLFGISQFYLKLSGAHWREFQLELRQNVERAARSILSGGVACNETFHANLIGLFAAQQQQPNNQTTICQRLLWTLNLANCYFICTHTLKLSDPKSLILNRWLKVHSKLFTAASHSSKRKCIYTIVQFVVFTSNAKLTYILYI